MNFKKIEEFDNNVVGWFEARGLINGNPRDQYIKMREEHGELSEGISKGGRLLIIKDSIGDIPVVLMGMLGQLRLVIDWNSDFVKDVLKNKGEIWTHNLLTSYELLDQEMSELLMLIVRREEDYTLDRRDQEYYEEVITIRAVRIMMYLEDLAIEYGLTFEECLDFAWNEIKDRKGRLSADGKTFLKEEDFLEEDSE